MNFHFLFHHTLPLSIIHHHRVGHYSLSVQTHKPSRPKGPPYPTSVLGFEFEAARVDFCLDPFLFEHNFKPRIPKFSRSLTLCFCCLVHSMTFIQFDGSTISTVFHLVTDFFGDCLWRDSPSSCLPMMVACKSKSVLPPKLVIQKHMNWNRQKWAVLPLDGAHCVRSMKNSVDGGVLINYWNIH